VVIVVNSGKQTVGLLADAVSDIIAIAHKDIQPVPDAVSFPGQGVLDGLIILDGGRIVTLVSVAKLLDVDEPAGLQAAA
jgi:purine-binding chemotaxis protein CheW